MNQVSDYGAGISKLEYLNYSHVCHATSHGYLFMSFNKLLFISQSRVPNEVLFKLQTSLLAAGISLIGLDIWSKVCRNLGVSMVLWPSEFHCLGVIWLFLFKTWSTNSNGYE